MKIKIPTSPKHQSQGQRESRHTAVSHNAEPHIVVYMKSRGVARILVWGYKFSRFSVHGCNKLIAPRYSPVLCVHKKDLISNGDYLLDQQS